MNKIKNMGLITLEGYNEDENFLNGCTFLSGDMIDRGIELDGFFKRLKKKVKKATKKVKKAVKKTAKKVTKTAKKVTSPVTKAAVSVVKPVTDVARNSGVYKQVAAVNQKLAKSPIVRTAAITAATVYGGPAGAAAAKMALDQMSGKKLNFEQLANKGGLDLAVNALAVVSPTAAAAANEYYGTAKEIKQQYAVTKEYLENLKNTPVYTQTEAQKKQALIEKYAKQLADLNFMFDEQVQKGGEAAEVVKKDYKQAVINQYGTTDAEKAALSNVYDQVQSIQNDAFAQQQAASFQIEPEYVDPGVIK